MTVTPTVRNPTADLLKGIAVVLMIQVHIMEQFAAEELLHSTLGRVSLFFGGPPAAPVFLAVMGWFAVRSSRPVASHMRRGALLILGGLMLNIGLNANLLYSLATGRTTLDLDPLAFIFGADILPLAGFSVIVLALLKLAGQWRPLPLLVAAGVSAAVAPVLTSLETPLTLRYLVPFFWGKQWWSYFPLFPWAGYVLLGAAASLYQREVANKTPDRLQRLMLAVLLLATLAGGATYAVPRIVELPEYYHHGLPLMLWIVAFVVLWTLLVHAGARVAGTFFGVRYFQWLGKNVTAAYVFQWLLIGNIATEIYRSQNLMQSAIWFAGILLLTSALILFYTEIKTLFTSTTAS